MLYGFLFVSVLDFYSVVKMAQTTIPQYFNYTPATHVEKQTLPRDMAGLIKTFNKSTIDSEIQEGKQRTMTEFLDDRPGYYIEFCYVVIIYSKTRPSIEYGPFRHREEALQRANDLVSCGATDVQVLKYDSRYLDDRRGNWIDIEIEWVWNKEESVYSF